MIKIYSQNFIKYDKMYMKKLEKLKKLKQYKQYECMDRIRQNADLHMNVYNACVVHKIEKINKDIDEIDKCLKKLKTN